ncbi:hypothetical protein ADU88_05605 [Clostridium botulinum]|nr:hypothetical protein ADU88_05605 [Clostridium botulinum]
MRFSKLKMDGIDIYTQYTNKFKNRLEEYGLNLFRTKDTEVSIPIAALNSAYEVITGKPHTPNFTPIPSDARENQLCLLKSNQLTKCFDITLEALDITLNFIYKNNLNMPNRIDYITYLTGFFVFNKNKELNKVQKNHIIDWYKTVTFTNQSNNERRKMFSDLLQIYNI